MDARSIKAVTYLSKQPILHMDMLHIIGRGTAEVVAVSSEGVLLYDTISQVSLITADTQKAAIKMVAKILHYPIVCHQMSDTIIVENSRIFQKKLCCYQATYTSKRLLDIPLQRGMEIMPLKKQDLPLILRCGYYVDATYLKARYTNNQLWGAYKGGTLAGFIGIHEQGSIGMLHVFDTFKRQEIASILEGYLTDLYVKKGLVPFAQIEVDNEPSIRLHKKLGYQISDAYLTWFND